MDGWTCRAGEGARARPYGGLKEKLREKHNKINWKKEEKTNKEKNNINKGNRKQGKQKKLRGPLGRRRLHVDGGWPRQGYD